MTTRPLISLALLSTLCALTASATAEPYWYAYEGNDFPENEGWERIVDGPQPAERTLADGIMTIDGLADRQIDDYYRMERSIDAGPGGEFVMDWRLRVDEVIGHPLALYDPGVAVWSDDDWAVSLLFGTDFVYSLYENIQIAVDPGVYHTWEFRSSDMRSYDLMVDGALIRTGLFWEPTFERSKVTWGDKARGSASLADWDYLRFGVVPEPGTIILFLVAVFGPRARDATYRSKRNVA